MSAPLGERHAPDRYESRADVLEYEQIRRWEESGYGFEWWQHPDERERQEIIQILRKASKTYVSKHA